MDRLDAMELFVAIADERGFAAAARRLALSPSAATRSLAALETRLGTRLLQRTTRAVTLTDAGVRFLERARRILADVGEAEAAAHDQRTTPAGRFVVSAPQVFGRVHVAPLMSTYLARYPAVQGELRLADRPVSLVDEGVDVAVRIGVLDDASHVARLVGATRRVLVGAPTYLATRALPRAPRDLARHALIQITPLAPTAEWTFHRKGPAAREERVAFVPCYVTNGADAAIAHAVAGGGLTVCLAYQVVDEVRRGKLRVLLPGFEPPPLPIHVVFPSPRLLSATTRAFVTLASAAAWNFVDV